MMYVMNRPKCKKESVKNGTIILLTASMFLGGIVGARGFAELEDEVWALESKNIEMQKVIVDQQRLLADLKVEVNYLTEIVDLQSSLVVIQEREKEKAETPTRHTVSRNVSANNLLLPSHLSAEEIDKMLNGTALAGLGWAYVNAEQQTGINASFLVSLSIHESGWGKSSIAKDKNNLFGLGAYDGSAYKSAISFGSKEECISYAANHLVKNYLTEGGKYYSGTSIHNVHKRYASDPNWANKVINTMKKFR